MKDSSNIDSVTIEYKENEDAKEKFIKFILDYFLEDDLSRKVDSDERFSKRN